MKQKKPIIRVNGKEITLEPRQIPLKKTINPLTLRAEELLSRLQKC